MLLKNPTRANYFNLLYQDMCASAAWNIFNAIKKEVGVLTAGKITAKIGLVAAKGAAGGLGQSLKQYQHL